MCTGPGLQPASTSIRCTPIAVGAGGLAERRATSRGSRRPRGARRSPRPSGIRRLAAGSRLTVPVVDALHAHDHAAAPDREFPRARVEARCRRARGAHRPAASARRRRRGRHARRRCPAGARRRARRALVAPAPGGVVEQPASRRRRVTTKSSSSALWQWAGWRARPARPYDGWPHGRCAPSRRRRRDRAAPANVAAAEALVRLDVADATIVGGRSRARRGHLERPGGRLGVERIRAVERAASAGRST